MLIELSRSLKVASGSTKLRSHGFWQNAGKRSFEDDLQANTVSIQGGKYEMRSFISSQSKTAVGGANSRPDGSRLQVVWGGMVSRSNHFA